MAQIFLSYSHQNAAKADLIVEALTADGYSLWWDRKLRAADDYTRDIEAQLNDAKCVVVVWSAAARNSLWVRAEANAALQDNKLIQVTVDNAKPPLPFTMLHLPDLSHWQGEPMHPEWREVRGGVHTILSGGGMREREIAARQATQPFFAPMIAVGAGSIGLVAVTGALAAFMASSPQQPDMFGSTTIGLFIAATLGLGYMLMRTVEIGMASRRRT